MIANRYTLEREIGRGGMGAVWLGHDRLLDRKVAIKRVGRGLPGAEDADHETDHERAEREARIAASVNHPHVVDVFDLVEEPDQRWLVMEYVDGRSLSQVVREDGPLDPDRAGAVMADVAAALATAHAEGIVHRDVKPSNILLSPGDEAKLLDFGIARAQGDRTLTQTGLVSGSPAYLSPEVASGRQATTASDVWSLGATLFHLLTGRPPYDIGDNVVGGLYRIVHADPPTVEQPGWLAPLLAATMVRDPDRRWSMARAASFLESGAGAAAAEPVTQAMRPAGTVASTTQRAGSADAAARGGRPDRSRVPAALLAVLVLLLVVGIAAAWLQPDEQRDPPATTGSASPSGPASSSPASPGSPSASPDRTRSPRPDRPTAQGIRSFIRGYLTTASDDPPAGFEMLTPAFQQRSGGLSGYEGFWGRVQAVEGVTIDEVDVPGLEVGYTYRYRTEQGGTVTDQVRLQLAYDAAQDRYRIADEA